MGHRSSRICSRRSSGCAGFEPVDDGGEGVGRVGGGDLGGELAGAGDDGGVVEYFGESVGEAVRGELARGEGGAGVEAMEASGVVGLVVGHGHEELGDAGGEALAEGADAAVVDEGAGVAEEGAEGDVIGGVDGVGEVGGELREVAGDEDAGAIEFGEGGCGGGEEGGGLDVGAAGGEDDGGGGLVAIEEGLEFRGEGVFAGEIFEGEGGLEMGLGPVGLRGSEPVGEEEERAVWGVPPLMKEAFWGRDFKVLAEAAENGAGEEVEWVGAVAEEEGFDFDGQELKEAMDGGDDDGGIVSAEDDGGLEVDGDEGDAEFFAGQAGTESGDRSEDEVGGTVRGGVGGECVVEDFGGLGGVFEDGLGAGAEFPDAGIAHEDFEVGILADGDERDVGGVGGLFEEAGGDEERLVTVGAEVTSQPDEGQDVTGGAEGEKGDFQRWGKFEFEEAEKQGRRRSPWRRDLTVRNRLCNGFTACSGWGSS